MGRLPKSLPRGGLWIKAEILGDHLDHITGGNTR
jgi:hypothetical protein